MSSIPDRTFTTRRITSETQISAELNLDGLGTSTVQTGIGFLDHMMSAFAKHGRFDLSLTCDGDLEIDDHHTVEDCGIVLGQAIAGALSDRSGICRFGYAYAPLDEALARTVVDISGRAFGRANLGLTRERLGALSCENVGHFFTSLASAAQITLHIDVLEGENDHHRAEAAFKSFALAMRMATRPSGFQDIPSTKGSLSGVDISS